MKTKKGFALVNKEKLREISRKAGEKAHELGRAHQFNKQEAKTAGSMGGKRSTGRKLSEDHKRKISAGMSRKNGAK